MNRDIPTQEIKAELATRGITQREIAEMLKISPVSVNNVISGKRRTPRILKAISWAIGKLISELLLESQKVTQAEPRDNTEQRKEPRKSPVPQT